MGDTLYYNKDDNINKHKVCIELIPTFTWCVCERAERRLGVRLGFGPPLPSPPSPRGGGDGRGALVYGMANAKRYTHPGDGRFTQ